MGLKKIFVSVSRDIFYLSVCNINKLDQREILLTGCNYLIHNRS